MNITEILQRQAAERPDAPAIIDVHRGRDRTTTFAELESAAARGATLLLQSGLRPGEMVLLFQPMSAELYTALLAILAAGMTAMFLDPSAGRSHLERCCAILPPAALVASPKAHLLRLVSPALRRIPLLFAFGRLIPGAVPWGRSERLPPNAGVLSCHPDTPALITFTSGSTGVPKAAVRSHGFLLEQHRVLERAIHLTTGAIDLTTLPVFVLANLASGVTSLIPDADLRRPGFIDPGPVLAQIERFRPASTVASPAFLERLRDGCAQKGGTIGGFRHVFTGGAPVFPDSLERFAALFPGAQVVAVYGSTEAEPIAHIGWHEMTARDVARMETGGGLLAGRAVPEIRVRIIAAQWGESIGPFGREDFDGICLAAGATGEIVVSGGHVLKGYLNGVGDGETKFRVDGEAWHRTGDCGYLDETGRLWLMGRASAIIRDDRGTLYPFAVECASRRHPAVRLAALVSRAGRRILCVEPAGGAGRLDTAGIMKSLAWATLDEVRAVPRIPLDRRHNAKVDYPALHEMLG